MKSVALIGDSIRMGYQATVESELDGIAEIRSPSENGGNSANVLAHLDEWVLSHQLDIVHLNCGLHDLLKDFDAAESAIPVAAYRENLRTIFKTIQDAGIQLIWATTTPVNEERHHAVKGFDRFEHDVDVYNAAAAEVTSEFGVPVDDLYAMIMRGGRDELIGPDGVHFPPAGSEVLGKTVAAYLRPYLEA